MLTAIRTLIRRARLSLPLWCGQVGLWEDDVSFLPRRDRSGARIDGPAMRRLLPDGTYEFRAATEAENNDFIARRAW